MIGRMGVSTRAVQAEIGGNKTHGVADRLEEEEREEAAHARCPWSEGDAGGEDAAPHAEEREQQSGVHEVEHQYADEAGCVCRQLVLFR